jgi:2-methylcitrate dehydratase PrpD
MANYFGGRYDREQIVAGLGETFTGGLTLYKRWSAVGTAHSHIQASIDIVTTHDISPEEIDEITVFVGDYHQLMCDPLDVRRAPKTLVDAKFSLPFLVAVAIVRRDLRLADFQTDGLADPRVAKVAEKIRPREDPSLDWTLELPPGRVEIALRDGRRFSATGTRIPGSAEAPMTWDDLRRKFTDCASVAARPIAGGRLMAICRFVDDLEHAADATKLLALCDETD